MKTDLFYDATMQLEHENFIFLCSQIKIFECKGCYQRFNSIRGLRQHEGKIHTTSEKVIKCLICERLFKNIYSLKAHNDNVHEKLIKITCGICKKILFSKYTFKKHLKVKHPTYPSLD